MELFGIGWMEMIVIALVALIVVGPKRLPQAAQTVGRLFGYATQQWRNIQQEIRRPMDSDLIDIKGEFEQTIQEITDLEPLVDVTPKQSKTKQSQAKQ